MQSAVSYTLLKCGEIGSGRGNVVGKREHVRESASWAGLRFDMKKGAFWGCNGFGARDGGDFWSREYRDLAPLYLEFDSSPFLHAASAQSLQGRRLLWQSLCLVSLWLTLGEEFQSN